MSLELRGGPGDGRRYEEYQPRAPRLEVPFLMLGERDWQPHVEIHLYDGITGEYRGEGWDQ